MFTKQRFPLPRRQIDAAHLPIYSSSVASASRVFLSALPIETQSNLFTGKEKNHDEIEVADCRLFYDSHFFNCLGQLVAK